MSAAITAQALAEILEHLKSRAPVPPVPQVPPVPPVPPVAGVEKHITTVMVAAILALGIWLFQSTNASQQQLAVLATNVAAVQTELVKLSGKLDDRAIVDAATAGKLADQGARLTAVEGLAGRLRDRTALMAAEEKK